jgi:hypothetical protein
LFYITILDFFSFGADLALLSLRQRNLGCGIFGQSKYIPSALRDSLLTIHIKTGT